MVCENDFDLDAAIKEKEDSEANAVVDIDDCEESFTAVVDCFDEGGKIKFTKTLNINSEYTCIGDVWDWYTSIPYKTGELRICLSEHLEGD